MREDQISRRKVLLLAGLATGLTVPAATLLTASDAQAQQDTSAPASYPRRRDHSEEEKEGESQSKC
jgi:hypothetical protein